MSFRKKGGGGQTYARPEDAGQGVGSGKEKHADCGGDEGAGDEVGMVMVVVMVVTMKIILMIAVIVVVVVMVVTVRRQASGTLVPCILGNCGERQMHWTLGTMMGEGVFSSSCPSGHEKLISAQGPESVSVATRKTIQSLPELPMASLCSFMLRLISGILGNVVPRPRTASMGLRPIQETCIKHQGCESGGEGALVQGELWGADGPISG